MRFARFERRCTPFCVQLVLAHVFAGTIVATTVLLPLMLMAMMMVN
jgi:hypothetical protein